MYILPVMISKKQLRFWMGGGIVPISNKTLTRRLIRDGILDAAGVSWDEIKTEQFLPPHVTLAVIERYKITQI